MRMTTFKPIVAIGAAYYNQFCRFQFDLRNCFQVTERSEETGPSSSAAHGTSPSSALRRSLVAASLAASSGAKAPARASSGLSSGLSSGASSVYNSEI